MNKVFMFMVETPKDYEGPDVFIFSTEGKALAFACGFLNSLYGNGFLAYFEETTIPYPANDKSMFDEYNSWLRYEEHAYISIKEMDLDPDTRLYTDLKLGVNNE